MSSKNREAWLNRMVTRMRPLFAQAGASLPEKIRIAIGFTGGGKRSKAVGQCWDRSASGDSSFEIFIVPQLDDSLEIATTLAHELTHAAVGVKARHGPDFGRAAKAIGLKGPMRLTPAGDAFLAWVRPVLDELGPIPHASLTSGISTGPKTQTTRLLKVECPACGYIARVTRTWIDVAGAPICPTDRVGMAAA